MLRSITALAAFSSLAFCAPSVLAQDEAPIEVMVLGSYHFSGGADLHNLDVDNHTSPTRRAEIAVVLDQLERFAPTKVMVELTPDREDVFNERYREYLAGEYTLRASESQQIGMAMAGRFGHEQLYAVDYRNGMDFSAMVAAAEASQQTRVLSDFANFNANVVDMMGAMENGTVYERLAFVNSQDVLDLHNGYLVLAQMGSVEDPVGARNMGDWWERNLIIFSNIASHAEPGDRILVVYGSGHKYLLDQFFDEAPGFELVDPLDYLQ
ncbi:DUF5694 domain-containing protein [Maricaulis sp.]|uniref:DUF5694 domain-containing protein n=1 Tax=Maricaulis sp. TaxID=1486257 RepID=UPI0026132F20|nr:DUF5694 domain-containing protein [Maricaulis sp.]